MYNQLLYLLFQVNSLVPNNSGNNLARSPSDVSGLTRSPSDLSNRLNNLTRSPSDISGHISNLSFNNDGEEEEVRRVQLFKLVSFQPYQLKRYEGQIFGLLLLNIICETELQCI